MTTDDELETKDSTREIRSLYETHEADLYDKEGTA
jgi:hypothetical protein